MTGYKVELPEVTYVGVLPRREVTGDNSIEKLYGLVCDLSPCNFGERVVLPPKSQIVKLTVSR